MRPRARHRSKLLLVSLLLRLPTALIIIIQVKTYIKMVSGAVIAAELSWQSTIGAIRSTGGGLAFDVTGGCWDEELDLEVSKSCCSVMNRRGVSGPLVIICRRDVVS